MLGIELRARSLPTENQVGKTKQRPEKKPQSRPSDDRENWLQSGMTTAVIFINHRHRNVYEGSSRPPRPTHTLFYVLGRMHLLVGVSG